jgi:predicted nucleic acid-binding protein
MPNVVISDTSCLIILDKIGELDILKCCYQRIYITSEIAQEYGNKLPEWIEVKQYENQSLKQSLQNHIDEGEATAITLATELSNCKVILDDLKARRYALSMNLQVTGTLGVIVKAKNNNCIVAVKPIIEKLKTTDFRLSSDLISLVLQQANE